MFRVVASTYVESGGLHSCLEWWPPLMFRVVASTYVESGGLHSCLE